MPRGQASIKHGKMPEAGRYRHLGEYPARWMTFFFCNRFDKASGSGVIAEVGGGMNKFLRGSFLTPERTSVGPLVSVVTTISWTELLPNRFRVEGVFARLSLLCDSWGNSLDDEAFVKPFRARHVRR